MKKGFTLIEVIVAIAMISLLILAITGLTSMSIKMNLEANKRDESFNVARSICEIYKSSSDTYSSVETEVNIYKYINSLSEVQSINHIIENKDGYYNEANYNEVINGNNCFKYTLILKIKRILNNENMEGMWIELLRNDGELMKIKMNIAK